MVATFGPSDVLLRKVGVPSSFVAAAVGMLLSSTISFVFFSSSAEEKKREESVWVRERRRLMVQEQIVNKFSIAIGGG